MRIRITPSSPRAMSRRRLVLNDSMHTAIPVVKPLYIVPVMGTSESVFGQLRFMMHISVVLAIGETGAQSTHQISSARTHRRGPIQCDCCA